MPIGVISQIRQFPKTNHSSPTLLHISGQLNWTSLSFSRYSYKRTNNKKKHKIIASGRGFHLQGRPLLGLRRACCWTQAAAAAATADRLAFGLNSAYGSALNRVWAKRRSGVVLYIKAASFLVLVISWIQLNVHRTPHSRLRRINTQTNSIRNGILQSEWNRIYITVLPPNKSASLWSNPQNVPLRALQSLICLAVLSAASAGVLHGHGAGLYAAAPAIYAGHGGGHHDEGIDYHVSWFTKKTKILQEGSKLRKNKLKTQDGFCLRITSNGKTRRI